jgi:hypothetical protein
VVAIVLASCGASTAPIATHPIDTHHGATGEIVGLTTREEIEAELPAWRDAIANALFDHAAAVRLAHVESGAEVDVFLGTWCGDSRREVSRLFRAFERADTEAPRPFALRFVGVDRAKTAPGYTESVGLRYVPTIVVRRGGVEVGRIVESAPGGVDVALADLLDGTRSGVITGRTDL